MDMNGNPGTPDLVLKRSVAGGVSHERSFVRRAEAQTYVRRPTRVLSVPVRQHFQLAP